MILKALLPWIFCLPLFAQIEAPNYNFKLEELAGFLPGQTLGAIKAKYGEPEKMQSRQPRELYRFSVKHERYQFPVFVETNQEVSVGFFARLPNYFLHDLFHQSLLNRLGPQDEFQHRDGTSVYGWKNKETFDWVYSGACTITCFPIYLSVFNQQEELLKKLRTD